MVRDVTERHIAEETFCLVVVGTAATTGSDFFQSLVQHMAGALRTRYAFLTACDDQKHDGPAARSARITASNLQQS
jgi:hypothetical protein